MRMFWLLLGIGCSFGEGLFCECCAISRRSLFGTRSICCSFTVMMTFSEALSPRSRRVRALQLNADNRSYSWAASFG